MTLGWFGATIIGLAVVAVIGFTVFRGRVSRVSEQTLGSPGGVVARRLAGWSFVPVVAAGFLVIAIVGGMGAWDRLVGDRVGWFDLDSEASAASALSALLFLAAASAAFLVAASRPGGSRKWPWATASAGLVMLAIDERRAVHEQLEISVGTDWQLLYLPVFLTGGALGAVLLRDLRGQETRWMFFGAVALWCFAHLLEMAQWDGDQSVDGYDQMMVIEEIGEMAGSLLLTATFLDHARRPVAKMADPSPRI